MFNSNIRKKLSIVLVTVLTVNTFFGVYGNNIDLMTNKGELEVSNYERMNLESYSDESIESVEDDFTDEVFDENITESENIVEDSDKDMVENIDSEELVKDKTVEDEVIQDEIEEDEVVESSDGKSDNEEETANEESENIESKEENIESKEEKEEKVNKEEKEEKEETVEDEKESILSDSSEEKESVSEIEESKETENTESSVEESEKESLENNEIVKEETNLIASASDIVFEDLVASESEISFYGRSDNVLSFMSKFERKDYDYKNGVLNIYSDLVFDESFVITEDIEINLNEKTIKSEVYDKAVVIKNANVIIKNGSIVAKSGDSGILDGNTCIEIYDSNLTIDNAKIFGGDGYSIKEDIEKPGNGGMAIYGEFTDNTYSITFNSGVIRGGKGGDGYEGNIRAYGGEGLIINDMEFDPTVYEYIISHGLIGDFGGGNGGDAIHVNGEISEENIIVNNIGIKGGDAGKIFSNKRKRLKAVRYGSELPTSYDSRIEGYVTPLRDQEGTALCATFTICAVAETNMIKNYPDYIRSLGYDTLTDFDLSEVSEGYFYLNPPEDKMGMIKHENGTAQDVHGNQRYSSVKYDYEVNEDGSVATDWHDFFATQFDHYMYGSSFRGFQAEEVLPWSEYTNSHFDEELTKNQIVHLKNTEHFSLNEYNDYSNPNFLETFSYEGIERIKRAVVKNGAVGIGIKGEGSSGTVTIDGETYSVMNSISFGSSSGHMVAIIGYDDNFDKDNFPEEVRPKNNGAFLVKNSSGGRYDWMSYEYNYGNFGDVLVYDFVPASGVLYDNIYFYDAGINSTRTTAADRYAVRFKCVKEAEKVTAVSVIVGADINNATVKVYKVGTKNLEPVGEILEKQVNLFNGLNFIEFERDEFFEIKKDELYVVEIQCDEKFPMRVDANASNGKYATTFALESFRYDSANGIWRSPSNMNYRIKAITSDTFKVTYDSNGGQGSMESDYGAPGDTIKIKENTFTRTKYEFVGWKDASGNFYEKESDIANIRRDITLYAQWNEIFIITFNGNGGTGTMTAMEVASGSSANIKANEFVRDLYEIDRWRDSDGNYYSVGGSITPRKDLTLYVEWKRYEYVVSFNGNGGSGNMSQFRVRVGSSANIPANTFTRTKYEFIGWKDGSGRSYTTSITPTDDVVLYAQWNEIFIITFNGNGGTGTMTAMEVASGSSANIKANEFVRDLYEIDRWRDSDGNYYSIGGSITPRKDLTLYVEWKRYEYVVSFNGNGGSGNMAQFRVRVGSSANIPANTFTRTKYEFVGWKDGSGMSYTTSITPTDDVVLYAQWNEIFIITFNGNGGTGTMTAMEVASGSSANIKANEFVRDLYEIDRWRDGDGNYYSIGGSITPRKDLTLYVEWKRYEYVVSFNSNGGSGNMAQFRVRVGSSANIPANTFTRIKYEFIGWKDGSGRSYTTSITPTDDVVLYAQWLRTHYSISYNANGGSGSMAENIVATGSSVTISTNSFTRSRYSFVNWKDRSGVSYNNGDVVTPVDDLILYAQWRYVGGGSNGSGSSGGGGGGTIRLDNVTPNVDYHIGNNVSNSEILLGAWSKNEENNKWRLYYVSYASNVENATNGFYKIISEKADDKHINEYLFDKDGYMVTGIVADDKGNAYFMEDEPTSQMGMKVVGWKKKGDYWYCMDATGLMYKNTTTPDGYYVDAYGRWQDSSVSNVNSALNNNVIVSSAGGGTQINSASGGYPQANSASGGGLSDEELMKTPEVINLATAIALMNTPDGKITVPQVLTIAKVIVANYKAANSSGAGDNNTTNSNTSTSATLSNDTNQNSSNNSQNIGAAAAINFGTMSNSQGSSGGSSIASSSSGGSSSSATVEGLSAPASNSSGGGGGSESSQSGPIIVASSGGSSGVINTMN